MTARLPFPDGVLVVDKPQGPTSHDVVTLARRALGVSRIGHTGTLDPMATGVLPLVIGRATRLAQFLTASDKDYEATVAFGRTTNTYDAMGTIITTSGERPTRDQVEQALGRFRGTFEQTPPAFSAKNIAGARSYDIARKARDGVVTLPKAVTITVRELNLISCDGETAVLQMRVTAGFYVRSLAHDLGAALGMGGVLTALRRTRSGEFGLEGSVPLADVLQAGREALAARLLPFSLLLPELPAVTLRGPEQVVRIKNGVEIAPADLLVALTPLPELVRVIGADGTLVALARPAKTPGFLHASVVF
ncbi:MAG: tRNA pseudouridine(55) synthase TruB [Acidobacterium sp.]|nr:tRNA pseudouridine(55) synthase TruB [Acidobacteriota bacterium]PHY12075.1 MAG: tRNA pseudouridine(55) synthase TruB [Acidobacterium sp.]